MSMVLISRIRLRQVARLLEEDARQIREVCSSGGNEWACGQCRKEAQEKCSNQIDHDVRLSMARGLRGIARR